jgi:hypothetical protein
MNDLVTTASYTGKVKLIPIFFKTLPVAKKTKEADLSYYKMFSSDLHILKNFFKYESFAFMDLFSEFLTPLKKKEQDILVNYLNHGDDPKVLKFVYTQQYIVDLLNYKSAKFRKKTDMLNLYVLLDYYVLREEIVAFMDMVHPGLEITHILKKLFAESGNCLTFEEYLDKKSRELLSMDVDSYLMSYRRSAGITGLQPKDLNT